MKHLLEIQQVNKLIKASQQKRKSKEIRHKFGAWLDAIEIIKGSDELTPEQIQSRLNNYLSQDQITILINII